MCVVSRNLAPQRQPAEGLMCPSLLLICQQVMTQFHHVDKKPSRCEEISITSWKTEEAKKFPCGRKEDIRDVLDFEYLS